MSRQSQSESPSIAEAYQELPSAPACGDDEICFVARRLSSNESCRIAKDRSNRPALLVISRDMTGTSVGAPIRLENLSITHGVFGVVSYGDGSSESVQFSAIQCTSHDVNIQSHFMSVLDGLVELMGNWPSFQKVRQTIDGLLAVFRAMTTPARKTVQGLWSELLLIANATDPAAATSAWHVAPTDLYDFSAGNQRLEVKSCSERSRAHYFSLDQLRPPGDVQVYIASVVVQRLSMGTSIADLAKTIRGKLLGRPELAVKLDVVIAETLGEAWQSAFDERFDSVYSLSKLSFFNHRSVPSIEADLPHEISNVRFRVDLTEIPPEKHEDLVGIGELIRNMAVKA